MGFWTTLFPAEPRGRKSSSPKRKRTASLDALVEQFAQASVARQATTHTTPLQHSYSQPNGVSAGLYRQEVPLVTGPRPFPVEAARPPIKIWHAPASPTNFAAISAHRAPLEQSWHPVEPLLPRAEPVRAPAPAIGATAEPSESTAKPNQCKGTTSTGKRCTRIVGPTSAPGSPARRTNQSSLPPQREPLTEANLSHLNRVLSRKGKAQDGPASDSERSEGVDDDVLPKFCHQHAKTAMQEPGTFAGRSGKWVRFDDWIPDDLPQETRLQLRYDMARPPTKGDKPGWLYVHEIAPRLQDDSGPFTYLKVGRSVKPVARLSQWKSQCPSRTPIVRGLFPSSREGGATLGGALAVNAIPAPYHHRWERLVLVEIAGRARLVNRRAKAGKCIDCGKQHRELFAVERGAYEDWVVGVLQRWQRWCEHIL